MDAPSPDPQAPETGALIAIVIIVALVIAGGIYFYFKNERAMNPGIPAQGAVRV